MIRNCTITNNNNLNKFHHLSIRLLDISLPILGFLRKKERTEHDDTLWNIT